MKRFELASACSVAALCLAFSAHAQEVEPAADPAQADARVLNVITVTANKTEQSLTDVPMSITAASGDFLEAAGIRNVNDLVKITPGLVVGDSSYGSPVYYMRGVGFFDTTLISKPTVSVYVDEVPLAYSAMTIGAGFDLERVEVLKGPQGTLFGSNATGGAINYIAAKPTPSFEAEVRGSYGRFDEATIGGFVSGPVSETLGARFAIEHESRGDWQESVSSDRTLGSKSLTKARVLLDWNPTDRFSASLAASGFVNTSDTQAFQFVAPIPLLASVPLDPRLLVYPGSTGDARLADWGTNFDRDRDDHLYQGSLRLDYDLSPSLTLTSISAYSDFEQTQGQDADGTTLVLSDLIISGEIESIFQEVRLTGNLENGGSWIIGTNYELSEGTELVRQFLVDLTSAKAFIRFGLPLVDTVPQIGVTDTDSTSVFANVNLPLTGKLTGQVGVRYTDYTVDFEGCALAGGNLAFASGFALIYGQPVPADGECVTRLASGQLGLHSDSVSEDSVSWRAGLDYKLDNGTMLYGNISRGYKSGGFSNVAASDALQYVPAVQEELTAYEVGFKARAASGQLALNGAAFYYDYTDKQLKGRVPVPVFGFLEGLVNVPKSEVKGVEFDVSWTPIERLIIGGGVTYLETEVTESFQNFTLLSQAVDFKGSAFPTTPELQGNLWANYSWDISPSLSGYAGGSLVHRGEAEADYRPDARLQIDAYTLLDLTAGIESSDGAWRLGVFGRNVTDEYYWPSASRRGDSIVRQPGMPATYGIEFTRTFN